MAQFPVSDPQGIIDGLNYVLSGPSGTGQELKGFFSDQTAYLTGNFRPPFTSASNTPLYSAPIALATATWLDSRTWRFDFAAAQPSPPYQVGNGVYVSGVTPSDYDGGYYIIGVVECTTTYVIVRTEAEYPDPGAGTGGTIEFYNDTFTNAELYLGTDCNAKVTVTGGRDRVLLTAQLNNIITYLNDTSACTFLYTVAVNRYKGSPNNDPVNPEFVFSYDGTVAREDYQFLLDVNSSGILTMTPAGTKIAYPRPADGAFDPAVDTVITGLNANAPGVGLDANINIQISHGAAGNYTTVNTRAIPTQSGVGFVVGDTITILGTSVGAATPANDLTLTVDSVSNSNQSLANVETIFTGIVDDPAPGYYWYILEVIFYSVLGTGPVKIISSELGLRSLAAQVLKQ